MKLKSHDLKMVLILGCGATRGALSHVVFKRKRLKPPLNADFFKVAETYARACGTNSSEAERLHRLQRVFREHLPVSNKLLTMETAFSLLFMAKDFPEIYSASRGRHRMPGDSQEIEDFLRLTSDILIRVDREATGETEYDALAGALRPRDVVVSLNYDTLLDSSLVRRGWDPRYGYAINGGPDKFHWRPTAPNPDLGNVRLLKLHGSLNWFVRGSLTDLSAVFSKKPTRIERPRLNEVSGFVRQIIPPIYGKFFDHDHWRTLWQKAYTALCEADALGVVGCSLIDTDFHLRAMIGKVAKYRKLQNTPFKQLYLVDRIKVRRRWARALKGAYRNQCGYTTFSQFVEKEIT